MSLTLLAPPSEPISASPSLTREQKRHIRETFAIIEPASDLVARLFYMKSVDLDPSLGVLFKSPNRVQRRKFMAAMKVTVLSLDRLQSLQPILKLLGARQREEGVNPGHYDDVPGRLGVDLGASRCRPASRAKRRTLGRRCSAR